MGDIFDSAVSGISDFFGSGGGDAVASAGESIPTDLVDTAATDAVTSPSGFLGLPSSAFGDAGGLTAEGTTDAISPYVADSAASGSGGFWDSAGNWITNNPGAALIGGTSLANGVLGATGAITAANTQANAQQQAGQTLLQQYNQTRADLAPYNTAGQNALAQLAKLYGIGPGGTGTPDTAAMQTALENYPGYKFAMSQGTQAIDRSAAAKGTLTSGGTLKDLTAYGQGLASQTFGNYLDRLNQLSTLGENAGAQTGSIGANLAQGIAGTQTGAGTASASGTVGATNAVTGSLAGGTQNYLLAQALANQATRNPSSYAGTGGY